MEKQPGTQRFGLRQSAKEVNDVELITCCGLLVHSSDHNQLKAKPTCLGYQYKRAVQILMEHEKKQLEEEAKEHEMYALGLSSYLLSSSKTVEDTRAFPYKIHTGNTNCSVPRLSTGISLHLEFEEGSEAAIKQDINVKLDHPVVLFSECQSVMRSVTQGIVDTVSVQTKLVPERARKAFEFGKASKRVVFNALQTKWRDIKWINPLDLVEQSMR
eukprot:TRINITY_DN60210_c0_g4_i1.p1 TRINITY_DN60210_c0_g4~~TRINITY_DN60210_c0_g4_i1.p1  ORF type:complete len:215 (-),score=48.74 TRINITY_DN60210_c0_g4_i1:158-802(-)